MRSHLPWLLMVMLLVTSTSGYADIDGRVTAGRRGDGAIVLKHGRPWPSRGVETVTGQEPTPPAFRGLAPDSPARAGRIADSSVKFEVTLWNIIRESGSPADYEAYLELFPNGRFARQARENLGRLKAGNAGAAVDRTHGKQPAPALEIRPIGQAYTVRVTANLRQAPSTKARIIGYAKKGAEIFVLGRVVGETWYQVSTQAGGMAYIAAGLIEKAGSAASGSATVPQGNTAPEKQTPASNDDTAKRASSDPKTPVSPGSVPSSTRPAAGRKSETAPGAARPAQDQPVRKSREEIERYWKHRIDLLKESGLHGDCDLVVDDPRTDPPAYSDCEENNDNIESFRRQMKRELAGLR